mmetsp:Transcript_27862/g.46820  ORF Transcript_27862/g.46820 Transcript_27862/m.46820 type:complete len:231 (-) Transcript_27862:2310-3002(-)
MQPQALGWRTTQLRWTNTTSPSTSGPLMRSSSTSYGKQTTSCPWYTPMHLRCSYLTKRPLLNISRTHPHYRQICLCGILATRRQSMDAFTDSGNSAIPLLWKCFCEICITPSQIPSPPLLNTMATLRRCLNPVARAVSLETAIRKPEVERTPHCEVWILGWETIFCFRISLPQISLNWASYLSLRRVLVPSVQLMGMWIPWWEITLYRRRKTSRMPGGCCSCPLPPLYGR